MCIFGGSKPKFSSPIAPALSDQVDTTEAQLPTSKDLVSKEKEAEITFGGNKKPSDTLTAEAPSGAAGLKINPSGTTEGASINV